MRFSIIIPIYNVRCFIERGLESLNQQTFHDFEIIMVDDGSTDGSAELLDDIQDNHPNIRVFHQKNSGAGPARNLGIDNAQGEYLVFFDIDDILRENALAVIDSKLNDSDADLLIFSYCEIDPTFGIRTDFIFEEALYNTNEELRKNYVKKLSGVKINNGFVWNKVYRRSFIQKNDINFESLRIQQDEVFNLHVYPRVERTKVISDILYDYYVYYSTNTRSGHIPERMGIYTRVREAFFELCSNWNIRDKEFTQYIHDRFFKSLLIHINENIYHQSDMKKNLRTLFNDKLVVESIEYLTKESTRQYSFPSSFYLKSIRKNMPNLFVATHTIDAGISKMKYLLRNLT